MTTLLAEMAEPMTKSEDEVLPPVGERVMIQCDGFRCIGYCDVNGCWRDAFDNHPLSGVLAFKPFASR